MQKEAEGRWKVMNSLKRDPRSSRVLVQKRRRKTQPTVSIKHLAVTTHDGQTQQMAFCSSTGQFPPLLQGQPGAAPHCGSLDLPPLLPKHFQNSRMKPQASPQLAPKSMAPFGKPQPPPVRAHFHHQRVALCFQQHTGASCSHPTTVGAL